MEALFGILVGLAVVLLLVAGLFATIPWVIVWTEKRGFDPGEYLDRYIDFIERKMKP